MIRCVQEEHPPLPPNISEVRFRDPRSNLAANSSVVLRSLAPCAMSFCPQELKNFLLQSFRKSVSERPAAAALLKHPWLAMVPEQPAEVRATQNLGAAVSSPRVLKRSGWFASVVQVTEQLADAMNRFSLTAPIAEAQGTPMTRSASQDIAQVPVRGPVAPPNRPRLCPNDPTDVF